MLKLIKQNETKEASTDWLCVPYVKVSFAP